MTKLGERLSKKSVVRESITKKQIKEKLKVYVDEIGGKSKTYDDENGGKSNKSIYGKKKTEVHRLGKVNSGKVMQ